MHLENQYRKKKYFQIQIQRGFGKIIIGKNL